MNSDIMTENNEQTLLMVFTNIGTVILDSYKLDYDVHENAAVIEFMYQHNTDCVIYGYRLARGEETLSEVDLDSPIPQYENDIFVLQIFEDMLPLDNLPPAMDSDGPDNPQ